MLMLLIFISISAFQESKARGETEEKVTNLLLEVIVGAVLHQNYISLCSKLCI